MYKRANRLCTDEEDKKIAREQITDRLMKNGYPEPFLKTQLAKAVSATVRQQQTWQGTVVIPYKQGTSGRVLNRENIRVAFKPTNSIDSMLVHLKDKISTDKTRNCVYGIKYIQCKAEYFE